jgi:hypothetical protein
MMRTMILVASISGALCLGAPGDVLAQRAADSAPPDPATTATAPGAVSPSRARLAAGAAQGGIYARPGRCRELAIGRKLSGLARQRFIKRCRIARRAMPRPVPSGPTPGMGVPAPGTPGTAPAFAPEPSKAPARP